MRVLVYSDDVNTRNEVILALGKRPHPDLPEVEYVECATEPVVIATMDAGGVDLAILDGEAVPAGGMGICRQLKDPAKNGGRDLKLLQEHVARDDLVAWGWSPGAGRDPAPGTQQLAGELVQAWIDSGAECPG